MAHLSRLAVRNGEHLTMTADFLSFTDSIAEPNPLKDS
jgi:hypothetical protein